MSDDKSISLEKLKSLIEFSSQIHLNYMDSDALLCSILESATRLVSCESVYLILLNKKKTALEFKVTLGPEAEEIKKYIVPQESIAGWILRNGISVVINDVQNDWRWTTFIQDKTNYIIRNMIATPIFIKKQCIGAIEAVNKKGNENFTKEDLQIFELFGQQASIAYETSINFTYNRIQLEVLQNAQSAGKGFHGFLAKNSRVLALLASMTDNASSSSPVLITGEEGVGKELFAEQVHLRSIRKNKPFIKVSCASSVPGILENELFGHIKGAFPEASDTIKGKFELADGGTLFLDEVSELPLSLQAKLLWILQEKQIEKVGSTVPVPVNVRIIAATSRNLEELINEGKFSSDLYFRLNIIPAHIPPLRERNDDIAPLCNFFLSKFRKETHKDFSGFTENAKKMIFSYKWPGNIRELENTIERACIIGKPPFIKTEDLRLPTEPIEIKAMISSCGTCTHDKSLKTAVNNFKKEYIKQILNETHWNQTKAAEILKVQRTYVSKLISDLEIDK